MNDKRARRFFLVLLVASLFLFFFINVPDSPIGPNLVEKDRDILATMLIVAQITAPIISALGLVITTYFTWRKDHREQLQQEFDIRNESGHDPLGLSGSTKPDPIDSAVNDLVIVDNQTNVLN